MFGWIQAVIILACVTNCGLLQHYIYWNKPHLWLWLSAGQLLLGHQKPSEASLTIQSAETLIHMQKARDSVNNSSSNSCQVCYITALFVCVCMCMRVCVCVYPPFFHASLAKSVHVFRCVKCWSVCVHVKAANSWYFSLMSIRGNAAASLAWSGPHRPPGATPT